MQRPVDKIAFGFQNNAGRREHDRLVSVHMGMGMTVGGATAPLSGAFRLRLQAAFEGTHYPHHSGTAQDDRGCRLGVL